MSIRLMIFDCDGVMFDSRAANQAFYNHILANFGLSEMEPDQINYIHMATAIESVDHIMPPELREKAQAFRLTVDYSPFFPLMVMEPELRGLLEFLRPDRKTAIATNRSNTIGPLLEQFELADRFDMVVSSLDVSRPKPDPECLNNIMAELGVSTAETLYIGDSEVDAQTARAAGVPLIAYQNPKLDAWRHIQSLNQVKGLLD